MKKTIILQEIFYALTGAYLSYFILELAWPGVVLSRLNTNWVLLLWLIIGILLLISAKDAEK